MEILAPDMCRRQDLGHTLMRPYLKIAGRLIEERSSVVLSAAFKEKPTVIETEFTGLGSTLYSLPYSSAK